MRKHHELKAWQEAMELVKEIYRVTRDFPKEEMYGLIGQMRRGAVSIPSNLTPQSSPLTPYLGVTDIQARIDKIFSLIGGLLRSLRERGKAKDAELLTPYPSLNSSREGV